MATEHASSKEQCTCSNEARWIDEHALLNQSQFAEVLGQEVLVHARLYYVTEALQEAKTWLDVQVELKSDQNRSFHLQDLSFWVCIVGNEYEVFELGDMNLLILSGKKQRSHSDKLKPSSHDLSLFQVSIDQINGEKECLCLQFKA